MGSCAWLSALFALQLACQAPALLSTRPLQDARSLETSSARLIHTVVPSECSEYQDWQVALHLCVATLSNPRCNTATALLSSGAWPVLVLEENRQPRHVYAHSLLRDGQAEGQFLVTACYMCAWMCLKLALHFSLLHRPCVVYVTSFDTYVNTVQHMQHICHSTKALYSLF